MEHIDIEGEIPAAEAGGAPQQGAFYLGAGQGDGHEHQGQQGAAQQHVDDPHLGELQQGEAHAQCRRHPQGLHGQALDARPVPAEPGAQGEEGEPVQPGVAHQLALPGRPAGKHLPLHVVHVEGQKSHRQQSQQVVGQGPAQLFGRPGHDHPQQVHHKLGGQVPHGPGVGEGEQLIEHNLLEEEGVHPPLEIGGHRHTLADRQHAAEDQQPHRGEQQQPPGLDRPPGQHGGGLFVGKVAGGEEKLHHREFGQGAQGPAELAGQGDVGQHHGVNGNALEEVQFVVVAASALCHGISSSPGFIPGAIIPNFPDEKKASHRFRFFPNRCAGLGSA